jgi:hypothetical protein
MLAAEHCVQNGCFDAGLVVRQKKYSGDSKMRHCKAILRGRQTNPSIHITSNRRAVNKTALLSVLIAFLVSSPLWAKKYPPRPFVVPVAVSLNGAHVPVGTYEITCETFGSTARVTLLKDGQFIATAPGNWVKTQIENSKDQMLVRINPDGSKSLSEIRIAGTAGAIVLDQTDGTIPYSALQR